MLPAARHFAPYCPFADLAERYPDWRHYVTDLHGLDEVIDVDRKLLLIDPKDEGEPWALAHSVAHLDLGHHEQEHTPFTLEQERDANGYAALRMDAKPSALVPVPLDWIERAARRARDGGQQALEPQTADWPDEAFPMDGDPTLL